MATRTPSQPRRLVRVAGMDIYLHWSFLLLLGWIFVSHLLAQHGLSVALQGVAFMATIFVCVVLHELGHALVAKRFGIGTRDITLYPIGGIARLERIPERPGAELLIALAGPAVNLAIAGLLWAFTSRIELLGKLTLVGGHFLSKIVYVNLSLALFNLVPAFPMDGGRALRALLAMRTGYVRATEIAARAGRGFAIGLGLLGLFYNPFLVFIAFFVFVGAGQEALQAQTRAALQGVPVRAAMLERFHTIRAHDRVADVLALFQDSEQDDFPVLEGERVIGVLTRADLLRALASGCGEEPVAQVMTRASETVEDSEMLDAAYRRMQEAGRTALPVVHAGKLVGMLTLTHLARWLMLRGAVRQARA